MDRVDKYRQIICDYLESFAEYDKAAQLVFDKQRDRYLAIHNEWRGERRIYGCAIQIDIINGKVWIQENNTETYVEQELMQGGVSSADILLGLRSPTVRELIAASKRP